MHLNDPSKFWHVPGEHFPGSSAHSLTSERKERQFIWDNYCDLNKPTSVAALIFIPWNWWWNFPGSHCFLLLGLYLMTVCQLSLTSPTVLLGICPQGLLHLFSTPKESTHQYKSFHPEPPHSHHCKDTGRTQSCSRTDHSCRAFHFHLHTRPHLRKITLKDIQETPATSEIG